MKRSIAVYAIFIMILQGCNFDENPIIYNLSGQIQKGPFVSGTTIRIQELDSNLNPTGLTYETTTNDDFGSFAISSELSSSIVEIIATGYYFNEVSGTLSDGPLTLRAIADLSASDVVNVNILTTLQIGRLKRLILEGVEFTEALSQSGLEILSIFNINGQETVTLSSMDITKSSDQDAILLAISAILQSTNTVAQLSELISHISLAVSQTGVVTDTDLISRLQANSYNLDLPSIRLNLANRYKNLGLTIVIPLFERYALLLNTTHPTISEIDPETNTLFSGKIVKVSFSHKMNSSSINSSTFIIKDSFDNSITGNISYNDSTYTASFTPENVFSDGEEYTVILTKQILDFANNNLESDYSWKYFVHLSDYCYVHWSPQKVNYYSTPPHFYKYKYLDEIFYIEGLNEDKTPMEYSQIDFSRLQDDEYSLGAWPINNVRRCDGILYLDIVFRYDTENYSPWADGKYHKTMYSDLLQYKYPWEVPIGSIGEYCN